MVSFEHYMYVVECADGTLYAGYSTNVESRVAVHNSGKGAKYTRSRLPVHLRQKARFYTKERAMSAEAHFKQVTRDKKEALLALAATRPLEEVLQEEIPGFGQEPVGEFVARCLCENQDLEYRDFVSGLTPSLEKDAFVGVRTPALRKIAKKLARREDAGDFLKATPHKLFEENQLHSFALGEIKDYEEFIDKLDAFLPLVDNWATCDQIPAKILMNRPDESLGRIMGWIDADHTYTARYGIQALMTFYLGDRFSPEFLRTVAGKHAPGYEKPAPRSEAYYMDMMRAWFFAEAMAKQPDATLPYLRHPLRKGNGLLDEWTRRKAIQKSVESYRIPDDLKAELRGERK